MKKVGQSIDGMVETWLAPQATPDPLADELQVTLLFEALVHQQDSSIIVSMPNAPPYCLVQSPECLLGIPLVSVQQASTGPCGIILLLHSHLCIFDVWERNANNNYAARISIRKVQPFRYLASKHSHQHRAVSGLDAGVVCLHGFVESVTCASWFSQHALLELEKLVPQPGALPAGFQLVQKAVARQEHENAVGHDAAALQQHISDAVLEGVGVRRSVG
mmetsp:Transcript_48960/g.93562  ORF Transcript_48960/g.93562 Transcript_48960/m.93562 type:complete len:219 (-) Transcript_48960:531-1187(-)